MIYLDYAASTPIREDSLEVLTNSMRDDYANPAAAHKFGKKLGKEIEQMRDQFITLLDAKGYEFIFTGSATESNNMAILHSDFSKGERVLYSEADHPSTIKPSLKRDVDAFNLPLLTCGRVDLNKTLELINNNNGIGLVTLIHVNNQTGVINDVEQISKKIKELRTDIHIHVDGVQALGKLAISLKQGSIDSYTISSHKVYGPKGVAGLYFKTGSLKSLLVGGGHEKGLRSSTPAYPLIKSFAFSVMKVTQEMSEEARRITELNTMIRDSLQSEGVKFLYEQEDTASQILLLSLPGISSDIMLRHLEMENIFVSSSSACSSKIKGDNPSFKALGIDPKLHKSLLRVSLGKYNNKEQINKFLEVFKEILNELKDLVG